MVGNSAGPLRRIHGWWRYFPGQHSMLPSATCNTATGNYCTSTFVQWKMLSSSHDTSCNVTREATEYLNLVKLPSLLWIKPLLHLASIFNGTGRITLEKIVMSPWWVDYKRNGTRRWLVTAGLQGWSVLWCRLMLWPGKADILKACHVTCSRYAHQVTSSTGCSLKDAYDSSPEQDGTTMIKSRILQPEHRNVLKNIHSSFTGSQSWIEIQIMEFIRFWGKPISTPCKKQTALVSSENKSSIKYQTKLHAKEWL